MALYQIPCDGCCDCLPCATELNIPEIFRIYNRFLRGEETEALEEYHSLVHTADECIRCGRCEKLCHNRIGISAVMFGIPEEME